MIVEFKKYERGDFSFLTDNPNKKGSFEPDKIMYTEAFKAIESVEGGWDFMAHDDPGDGGFMFGRSKDQSMREKIDDAICKNDSMGHSGATYGITMRTMQHIAKNGWVKFIQVYWPEYRDPDEMKKLREEFLSLPHDMTLKEQAEALEKYKDVPMTYSEMRERFG